MPREKKIIPNRLARYRMIMGFQQKEVAERLGIHDTAMISRWEKGLRMPSSTNLLKLSILYKVLANELYREVCREYGKELFPGEHINRNSGNSP